MKDRHHKKRILEGNGRAEVKKALIETNLPSERMALCRGEIETALARHSCKIMGTAKIKDGLIVVDVIIIPQ